MIDIAKLQVATDSDNLRWSDSTSSVTAALSTASHLLSYNLAWSDSTSSVTAALS